MDVLLSLPPPSTLMTFNDMSGTAWQVNIDELSLKERELVERQETVRLLGKIFDNTLIVFHSCGAFPWTLDKPMSREYMYAAREAFQLKIEEYKERSEKVIYSVEEVEGKEDNKKDEPETPCGEIEPVRRFEGR